jgi:hypothetical protein
MEVDEPAMASSSRTKVLHISEPNHTDVTRQQPFNYRSLPSHEPAICIDAGVSANVNSKRRADHARILYLESWVLDDVNAVY